MKGNSVAMCAQHQVPMNRCGCEQDGPELFVPESTYYWVPTDAERTFRERQARVIAGQWLDIAEARDRAESDARWERMVREREPDHWDPQFPRMPWWVVVLGVTCVLIALFGLYVLSNGGKV